METLRCVGDLILTNTKDRSVLYLAPVHEVSKMTLQTLEADLVGTWATKTKKFELTKAGTFVSNNQTGVWEVTQDGQYLIFHFQENNQTIQTKVMELVSVDHETLCVKNTTANNTAVFLNK